MRHYAASVGTPSLRTPLPCGFGTSTSFTGGGKYDPEDIRFHVTYSLFRRSASKSSIVQPSTPGPNDIKLGWGWQQPEDDPGQRGQAGGVAGFAVLVPAAGPLGLALVAAAGPPGDEVAVEGDLEGEVGSEVAEVLRGKSIRSR
jgi:hypothetical protein